MGTIFWMSLLQLSNRICLWCENLFGKKVTETGSEPHLSILSPIIIKIAQREDKSSLHLPAMHLIYLFTCDFLLLDIDASSSSYFSEHCNGSSVSSSTSLHSPVWSIGCMNYN